MRPLGTINPSNLLLLNYRRVIAASIMAIIFLVVISFFVTQSLFSLHKELDSIRINLNRQIQNWSRIERVILLQLDEYTEQAYISDVLGKRMQSTVAKELKQTETTATELEDQFKNLSNSYIYSRYFSGDDTSSKNTNVDNNIKVSVEKFSNLPKELLIVADQVWDVDIQIQFRSGKYLEPLQQTLVSMEQRKRRIQRISNMVFVCMNIALVLGVVLIWRLGLRPAFDRMNKEHDDKMSVISKLADANAEFQAAFFALEQASVIIDTSGAFLEYNTLFFDLLEIRKIDKDEHNFFTFLSSLETVSKISNSSIITNINDLTRLSEKDHIFIIGDRHYSMSCSSVTNKKWIILLNDHERFMRRKEVELNKKRLETLDYISGGVAHDFNNILGSILSRAELMEMGFKDEESIANIRGIIESCERGKVVTSNLLSYARQKKLNKQSMRTQNFLDALKGQLITPDNIIFKLENHFDTDFDVDIMQLITAVENLVKNAVDAIGDTKGEIIISVRKDTHFSHMAEIRVEDSGPGFSDSALKQATDPFFSTKSLQHGNGLGLSMVAGFISQSSGLLNFGNLDGGGAYVEILLPINVDRPHIEIEVMQQDNGMANNINSHFDPKSCLIIEDNIEIVNAMKLFFSPVFSIIKVATTCQEAENLLDDESNFDVVICDWTLPDGNSGNIIRKISDTSPETSILITTGNIGKDLNELDQEVSLKVFEKPISLHELREQILLEIG